jgi:ABC-type transport system involved in multi-copper enzyme maturation permease subunit
MHELIRSTLLFFGTHLRRSLTSRRSAICLALALMPAGIAWTAAQVSRRTTGTDIATHLGWLLILQIVVPLLALVGGTAVVTEEVEDRTITFLFSRPIPRASLLFGRWLATLVLLSVLLALGAGLTLWAASQATVHATQRPGGELVLGSAPGLNDGVALPLLQAVLLGAAVYSALFAAAGVFFKHPMIVGLGYAFVIEAFLANLPGKNQSLTVQYYLRSWIAASGSPDWNRVEGFASATFDTPLGALTTLGLIALGALALGAWRIRRREFLLTS